MTLTTTAILERAGRSLYGERWRFPLARAIGVSDETVRRWMNGDVPLPKDHRAFDDLQRVFAERIAELSDASRWLLEWRDR